MLKKTINKLRFSIIGSTWRNSKKLTQPQLELKYKEQDLCDEYYNRIQKLGHKELEHQIGRLTNYKKIIHAIDQDKLAGDIIEFGTWTGFSLVWIAYFFERKGIFDKKIFGVDSFSGLPNSEGSFEKYAFSDTSANYCRTGVMTCNELYDETKNNIKLIDSIFSDQKKILKNFNDRQKFCLIHIDCDISESMRQIESLVTTYDLIADKCFILFDDYGLNQSYAESVEGFMKRLQENFEVSVHSKTNFTKNFYLTKK